MLVLHSIDILMIAVACHNAMLYCPPGRAGGGRGRGEGDTNTASQATCHDDAEQYSKAKGQNLTAPVQNHRAPGLQGSLDWARESPLAEGGPLLSPLQPPHIIVYYTDICCCS